MAFEIEMQRIFRQIRPGLLGINNRPSRNLEIVIEDLKSNPKWLKQLQDDAREFLVTQDYVPALVESGLMQESGIFAEVFRKLEYKILPKAVDDKDFVGFLNRVFDAAGGADWISSIKEEVIANFLALLVPDGEKLMTEAGPQLFNALEILVLRLAYFGVEPDIYSRLKGRPDLQNAFLNAQHDLHKMLDGKGQNNISAVIHNLNLCRAAVNYIRSKRDRDGVSLSLTYKLMRIQEIVSRMHEILALLQAMLGDWNRRPAARLVKDIMVNETKRFEVRAFISRHIELLAYQITEHTGRTGEHYITSTRSEYHEMFRSAAIGGAMVALIVICKVQISLLPLAPAPQALSFGILYAVGFVAIHTVGGTLASKQPAMTASRIAAALDDAKTSEQAFENLTEMIVRTVRSQLIALFGNYFIGFPVAFALCTVFVAIHYPIASHAKAEHLLHDLHPWKTLSLWYAACAGGCLFLSGIFAGAADNWFVFNRVGKRLLNSRMLKRFVAPHNLKRASAFIEHNLGFWVGNSTLGLMLGGAGFIGLILGLPIDIRHVTFSSAQLGVAMANRPFEVTWEDFVITAIGVFFIGLVNLSTSFSLTLWMTMKSRKIRFSQTPELIRYCLKRFRQRPVDFFFPPPDPVTSK